MRKGTLGRLLGYGLLLLAGPSAIGQSSDNFRLRDGKVVVSSGNDVASGAFRVSGGIDGSGASGIASSANFRLATGVPTYEEMAAVDPIFRNGFESPTP